MSRHYIYIHLFHTYFFGAPFLRLRKGEIRWYCTVWYHGSVTKRGQYLLQLSTLKRSGVWPRGRVGDVRRRVWRVERHPLHVFPEPAKPLTAHSLVK